MYFNYQDHSRPRSVEINQLGPAWPNGLNQYKLAIIFLGVEDHCRKKSEKRKSTNMSGTRTHAVLVHKVDDNHSEMYIGGCIAYGSHTLLSRLERTSSYRRLFRNYILIKSLHVIQTKTPDNEHTVPVKVN